MVVGGAKGICQKANLAGYCTFVILSHMSMNDSEKKKVLEEFVLEGNKLHQEIELIFTNSKPPINQSTNYLTSCAHEKRMAT